MPRVLVIDDDHAIRNMMAVFFKQVRYECVLANNAVDGIARAENERFDVALIDMNMPGVDGLEAVKAISHIKPPIPIIAMSGGSATTSYADYDVLAKGVGAQLFLAKPFGLAQLMEAIANVLANRSLR